MKKILHSVKTAVFLFAAMFMVLGADVMMVHAQVIFPGHMTETKDGRIEIIHFGNDVATDSTGREWCDIGTGYPFCYIEETYQVEKHGRWVTYTDYYLDRYLTDCIKSDNESEWPSFVIKGSDGVPFYFADYTDDNHNWDYDGAKAYPRYVKYCYDSASGWWLEDKAYKGPFVFTFTTEYPVEKLIEETKEAIARGEEVNGTAKDPAPATGKDLAEDTEDKKPDKPVNPPTEEVKDPYADENTLGATVTISTDCIKVKKNNAPQKPLPKSVKIGKKALKRNKTFVVSYEKYENGWNATDAVREEGIYRLVVTGQNGYEGVYKKRLYVTADKTIKAMSSASVKVNKIPYSGSPITSGVIKSVKAGKRTLVEGEDYTVTYMNNLNSGTGQVKLTAVEGSGVLGTKTVNFTISGNKMSGVKVKGLQSLVWNPETAMEQNVGSLNMTFRDAPLTENTDFTVSYANNTKAGTARIIFTGTGLYNGTLTKTFKITKMKLDDSMLDEASKNIEMTRTGKPLKPEVFLKHGSTELVKGKDYTLAYSNNVKISTADKPGKITVKGKGNYTGSFIVYFTINEAEAKGDAATKQNQVTGMDPTDDMEDTVSGNDMTDDTVSENDIIDDSDNSGDDQNTGDGDQSDEGQGTDDSDQSGEEQNTGDSDESDEGQGTDDQNTDDSDQSGDDQSADDSDESDEGQGTDDQNTGDHDQSGEDQSAGDSDESDEGQGIDDQNTDDNDQSGEEQNTGDSDQSNEGQGTDDSDKLDGGQNTDDSNKSEGDQNTGGSDESNDDQNTDYSDRSGEDRNTDGSDQSGKDQSTDNSDQPNEDQNTDDSDESGEGQGTDD